MEPSARNDRLYKYGFGSVRLLFLFISLLSLLPHFGSSSLTIDWKTFFSYTSFGIGGAVLNLHVLSKRFEFVILAMLIISFLSQLILSSGAGPTVLVMYGVKTIVGDGLAGKLDRAVWWRSLAIVLVLWTVLSTYLSVVPHLVSVGQWLSANSFVFLSHLLAHWLVEVGDNVYVHVTFFRHRYSYEVLVLVLLSVNPSPLSVQLVLVDMLASLSYRLTNALCTFLFWTTK